MKSRKKAHSQCDLDSGFTQCWSTHCPKHGKAALRWHHLSAEMGLTGRRTAEMVDEYNRLDAQLREL